MIMHEFRTAEHLRAPIATDDADRGADTRDDYTRIEHITSSAGGRRLRLGSTSEAAGTLGEDNQ
jgi:hypothetical protein